MQHKPGDEIKAKQAGYNDAFFDGFDTFGEFPDAECSCSLCRVAYYAGQEEGTEATLKTLEAGTEQPDGGS